jgi:hypothetical protein
LLLPASVLAFINGVLNAWFFLLPPAAGHQEWRTGFPAADVAIRCPIPQRMTGLSRRR